MAGRPTILTRAVHDAIVAEVDRGTTLDLAAEMALVQRSTVYEWMQRGATGEQPFADFADAIAGARARVQSEALREIRLARMPVRGDGSGGDPDWKARAHYLSVANRRDFGQKLEVTQRVEETFQHALVALRREFDPATYERILAVMLRAVDPSGAGDGDEGSAGSDPH